MQRAIAEKLEVGGPRAEALGKLQREETGSNATDSRGDVAGVPMPKNVSRGCGQGRGDSPAGAQLAAGLLGRNHDRAVDGR